MKKTVLTLMLAILLAVSMLLSSCDILAGVCPHTDEDGDSVCDLCGASIDETKPACEHKDEDDDDLCDLCKENLSDEKACEHIDENDDDLCDLCGKDFKGGEDNSDTPECSHKDEDDDSKCDICGEEYSDGDEKPTEPADKPETPSCEHRDADDDCKCDECDEDYTDGEDVVAPHVHSFGEWTKYGEVTTTCDEQEIFRVCSGCKETEWSTAGYANHNLTTNVVAPTCKAQGYTEKVCSVCSFSE